MAHDHVDRTIRFAAETDAAQILHIYAPIVTDTAISFEEVPPSRSEVAGRIRGTMERYPWLVCVETGRILGYAYAAAFRSRPAYQWAVEVTVYIDPEAQRTGVARALYTSLLGILRIQGFTSALAAIALPNDPSVALHERFGFKPVGVLQDIGFKFTMWHDVEWWSLRLGEPRNPPDRPRTVSEVQATSPGLVESFF